MLCGLIVILLALASNAFAVTPDEARQHFERLKRFAGRWEAKSTKGWEGRYDVRVEIREIDL